MGVGGSALGLDLIETDPNSLVISLVVGVSEETVRSQVDLHLPRERGVRLKFSFNRASTRGSSYSVSAKRQRENKMLTGTVGCCADRVDTVRSQERLRSRVSG